MSFKSRDLMVKLSGSGQGDCGEQTNRPQDCDDCTHTGDCGQYTDVDDCTATDNQTVTCQCYQRRSREQEGSGAILALLRRQLQETLARPRV